MHRFRTPELFLGCFLTIAIFAVGMLFVKGPQSQQIAQAQPSEKSAPGTGQKQEPKTFWQTTAADPIATFTLCLVIVAAAQAAFFVVQLSYMRKGMEDATTVAKAAKVSADAAMKSAVVAENALIATDRAWISIKAEIIRSLIFDEDYVKIGVGFNLINVGKSPATHVDIWAELCPDVIAAKQQGRKAAQLFSHTLLNFGVVLFPREWQQRDWLEMEMPVDAFRSNIAAAKIRAKEHGDDDPDRSTARPAIMVCASYRLAGSSKVCHTVILYEVRHTDDKHFGWDGNVWETPTEHLRLVQTLMSGQVT